MKIKKLKATMEMQKPQLKTEFDDKIITNVLADIYEYLLFWHCHTLAQFAATCGESPIGALAYDKSEFELSREQIKNRLTATMTGTRLQMPVAVWSNASSTEKLLLLNEAMSAASLQAGLRTKIKDFIHSAAYFFTDTAFDDLTAVLENFSYKQASPYSPACASAVTEATVDAEKAELELTEAVPEALLVPCIEAFYALETLTFACNLRESSQNIFGHAEVLLLQHQSRKYNNRRLKGREIYVGLEPCLLCMSAIIAAHVDSVHYYALDPKAGAAQSCIALADSQWLTNRPAACFHEQSCFNDLTSQQLKAFFRNLRQQNKELNRSLGGRKQRKETIKNLTVSAQDKVKWRNSAAGERSAAEKQTPAS